MSHENFYQSLIKEMDAFRDAHLKRLYAYIDELEQRVGVPIFEGDYITPEDRARLTKIAEEAAKEWARYGDEVVWAAGSTNGFIGQHIAAFDPPTVLRLLREVERLRRQVKDLRQQAERVPPQCDDCGTTGWVDYGQGPEECQSCAGEGWLDDNKSHGARPFDACEADDQACGACAICGCEEGEGAEMAHVEGGDYLRCVVEGACIADAVASRALLVAEVRRLRAANMSADERLAKKKRDARRWRSGDSTYFDPRDPATCIDAGPGDAVGLAGGAKWRKP